MITNSPAAEPEVDDALLNAAAQLLQVRTHSVLLVEDTAAHAAIIRRALDASIWQIEHVTRASAALQSFSQNPHRIVLLDLTLPDSDGLELLARLHSLQASAPVIVVTSIDQVSVSVSAMQKGACDYVVKGDPKETAARISAALERAWRNRLQAAQNALVEQARLIELVRTERLEAVESIAKTACQEINNPLSAIITLTQLILKRQPLDQDIQRLAEGIAKSAAQAVEAVQKLQNT